MEGSRGVQMKDEGIEAKKVIKALYEYAGASNWWCI